MDVKLATPRLRAVRTSDETPIELQTTNADLVLWDRTRAKHKWPKIDEAPFLWLTFIGWAAARRSRVIGPELTYEAWESDVLAIEALDDDDEDDTGRPTPRDLGPD
jgi:hypothetical protein